MAIMRSSSFDSTCSSTRATRRGAGAEGLGDVALLPRGLDAVLLEVRGHPREDGDLSVDVGDGVCEPLLVELAPHDLTPVAAQRPR